MSSIRLFVLLAAFIASTGCESATSLDASGLEGAWLASVIEFTNNSASADVVDLIQRDGASYVLTVDAAGTATSVFDDGVGGTSSDSGTLNSTNDAITLGGQIFEATRDGDVLTLIDQAELFDFGTGSEVPATLRIVLGRQASL